MQKPLKEGSHWDVEICALKIYGQWPILWLYQVSRSFERLHLEAIPSDIIFEVSEIYYGSFYP